MISEMSSSTSTANWRPALKPPAPHPRAPLDLPRPPVLAGPGWPRAPEPSPCRATPRGRPPAEWRPTQLTGRGWEACPVWMFTAVLRVPIHREKGGDSKTCSKSLLSLLGKACRKSPTGKALNKSPGLHFFLFFFCFFYCSWFTVLC